jgi:hypothetical protein
MSKRVVLLTVALFAPMGACRATEGKPAGSKPGGKKPIAAALVFKRSGPPRDPAPVSAAIDAAVDARLKRNRVPASSAADDAEFLRRVYLDLTGRIPTLRQAETFLAGKDPQRRAKLIDELLDRSEYGQHFGTIWRHLLAPPEEGSAKYGRDTFTPWLAERFNANLPWDRIVRDLLTVEGPIRERPETAFLFANADNFHPQPNLVTASTARLFWGVQLGCAECHNHPFAKWKQDDFWATAAFFGRLRFSGFKGKAPILQEEAPAGQEKGPAITIPVSAGKAAGRVVPARFLDGAAVRPGVGPALRPAFAAWATGAEHPYFGRATVNRLWAHLFGRGIVHPVDDLDTGTASHPELLHRLTREFTASEFDLKHLIRCLCNSRAYQRTSRPVAGNENDQDHFARMTLKVLSPEVFYDSVAVVMSGDKHDPRLRNVMRDRPGDAEKARLEFVRFFRARGDGSDATEYRQGIPQLLRLLNAPLLDRGAPVVDWLSGSRASRVSAIEALFLTALSRRPTSEEAKRIEGYLEARKDPRAGYRGVLWVLLNSAEFAVNH